MIKFCVYVITSLLSFAYGLAAQEFALSLKDVRTTMEKVFAYHVENREFSPLVVRRSFKLYAEQFDPSRIYLLKDEIEPFLSVSPIAVDEVIENYHQDRFPQYNRLNMVIQNAIRRHREIQEQQIIRMIQNGNDVLSQNPSPTYSNYPSTVKELESRIYNYLLLQLKIYAKNHHKESLTLELIQKILQYRKKKALSHENFYVKNSDHMLAINILKSITKSLDAHTNYFTPREAFDICTSLKKEFPGIGVVLREDCDGVFISDLMYGSPAQRNGEIMIGDLLSTVDHHNVENITFEQLIDMMKGKIGEKIVLGIKRESAGSHVYNIELVRENIVMNEERLSFFAEPYGGGVIGKIKVPTFYDNGGQISLDQDLKKALKTLSSQGAIKGLVLDFRENGGGFLTQAVKVSSFFSNKGLVVVSRYANGEIRYIRNDKQQLFDGPLVILISKASASAAEIVAQTLQDHGVALVVGDKRSYGKGSMQYQTLTDERAKSFFSVTVGRYYTPSGRSPQIEGVKADIVVETIFSPYNIGEKYLEFPLVNDHLSQDVFLFLTNINQKPYKNHLYLAIPYLHPYESKWRKMLPQLNFNSKKRLSRDQNFQLFLKMCDKGSSGEQVQGEIISHNHGANDLQIKEAVEIIKDMILLYNQECVSVK